MISYKRVGYNAQLVSHRDVRVHLVPQLHLPSKFQYIAKILAFGHLFGKYTGGSLFYLIGKAKLSAVFHLFSLHFD